MRKKFLAGLGAAQFLQQHWQRAPLVARDALPEYSPIVTRARLLELARREDLESTLVTRARGRWIVRNGPFTSRDFARLPHRGWTLLVHGVDLALKEAARLAREFAFIPYARFDDVMVSYAAPEGGVGPHYDSYDVFLLQGQGRRRWRVGHQASLELVPHAPLKILRRFVPDREWELHAGDLLYVPPKWAHDGVAIEECITYSVGFRAPHAQELGERFLDYLRDRVVLEGMYEDAGSTPTREPALVPARMTRASAATLERLRWSVQDVTDFLGSYLSEPRPQVVFTRPRPLVAETEFMRQARNNGLALAAATRMLYRGATVFVNGESVTCPSPALSTLKKLANDRELAAPLLLDSAACRLLYAWYRAGYVELAARPKGRRA
jgi:50S ribosomal protein L16 3-hydroxylase